MIMNKIITLFLIVSFWFSIVEGQNTGFLMDKNEVVFYNWQPSAREKTYVKTQEMNYTVLNRTTKQKLDSTIFLVKDESGQLINSTKDVFVYNTRGYITLKASFQWDPFSKKWINSTRDQSVLDAKGNVTQGIFSQWDQPKNSWLDFSRNDYTYDSDNHMTSAISYLWNITGNQWNFNTKTEYSYDAKGNNTQFISFKKWDAATSKWIPNEKEENTFDAKNNKIVDAWSWWDETVNQWINTSKTEYVFNAGNSLTLYTVYKWDKTTLKWINDNKVEFTFDGKGNNVQSISSTWNATTSQWVYGSKSEYSYDINNNIIQLIFYQWNKTASQWVNNSKSDYVYDGARNITRNTVSKWNTTGNQWTPDSDIQYTYDSNGNRSKFIYSRWNASLGQWVISFRNDYLFDPVVPASSLLIPENYLFAFINDTVFNKVTGIVNYETDQQKPVSRYVMYYSDFSIKGNTLNASVCDGTAFSFNNKSYFKAGTYPDTLVSSMGYDSIISIVLSVIPVSQPLIQSKGDTLISVSAYPSYQWYNETGKITGAASRSYVITKSGKYQLVVVDANGCTVSSTKISLVYSSADLYIRSAFGYTVFPNPAPGNFYLRFDTGLSGFITVKLFNSSGQVVDERGINSSGNKHMEYFDVSGLAKGIYLLKVCRIPDTVITKIVIY
jgi:hypothetical protein